MPKLCLSNIIPSARQHEHSSCAFVRSCCMLHIVRPISLEKPSLTEIHTACASSTCTYSSYCPSRSSIGTFALHNWFVTNDDGPMAYRQHMQRRLQLKYSLLKQLRGLRTLKPSMLQQQHHLRRHATVWRLLLPG